MMLVSFVHCLLIYGVFFSLCLIAGNYCLAMDRKTIDLDQGWDYMQKGITKLKRILEGLPESPFSSEEYMMLYT